MKKLVYVAAIAFAACMVACGGNKAQESTEVEEAPVPEVVEAEPCCASDSCAKDSCANDSCCAAEKVVEEAPAE